MKKLLFIALALVLCLSLLPMAALADGDGSTTNYVQNVNVCNVPLASGLYYTAGSDGKPTGGTSDTPTSGGYICYDKSTGVLTLNNISLTANSYAITCSDKGSITINVVGTCQLAAPTAGRGINMDSADCTVTGDGTLTVTSANDYAIYVKTLTVNSGVTLNATAQGTSSQQTAIEANSMVLKGTVNATTCASYGKALSALSGAITIEEGANVSASGGWNAVFCNNGPLVVKGGKLTAKDTTDAAVQAKGVDVSGGEMIITTSGIGVYLPTGGVTVSGGSVNISSDSSCAIYISQKFEEYGIPGGEKIIVSGGTLTARSLGVTLWGNKGVEISGGAVTAISTGEVGIYSPANVSISGGTVAAAGPDSYDSIRAKGTLTINGDAVVYGKKFSTSAVTEGVVYTGTNVSLDSDGKTVLSGGVGTVYGDPNVTGFATPESAALSTALDAEYIEISAQDMTYSGSPLTPTPTVTVTKTAISRELVEGVDYTVVSLEGNDYTNVGGKTYKIQAVANSGCTGEKEFSCKVVEKELSWDAAGLGVSKTEDGKTDAAPVQGTLKLAGVAADDDVTLAYDGITAPAFPDAKAGSYTLTLTVTGAKLAGADKDNYKLPTADITVTAKIEAAAPVVTPAPDPTPDATATPAPNATATPAPTTSSTAAPEASATPAPTATPKATQAPATAPSTGDDSHAALWLLPLLAAVALLVVFGKKRARLEK